MGGKKRINMAISLGEDQGTHFALKSAAEKQVKRFVRTFSFTKVNKLISVA